MKKEVRRKFKTSQFSDVIKEVKRSLNTDLKDKFHFSYQVWILARTLVMNTIIILTKSYQKGGKPVTAKTSTQSCRAEIQPDCKKSVTLSHKPSCVSTDTLRKNNRESKVTYIRIEFVIFSRQDHLS